MAGEYPRYVTHLYATNNSIFLDQIELSSPPFDSVSTVRFSPSNPSQLLVSSWDTVSTA